MSKEKWMGKAFSKKNRGKLHKKLGVPLDKPIPMEKLKGIEEAGVGGHYGKHKRISSQLYHEAHAALNAKKRRK